jgi:hypothetical protein
VTTPLIVGYDGLNELKIAQWRKDTISVNPC